MSISSRSYLGSVDHFSAGAKGSNNNAAGAYKPILAKSSALSINERLQEESEKKYYWMSLISSVTSMVLCVIELLLCTHLLLEDTWSGLDVFVLQLVVYILTGLALCGLSLSVMGLWIVATLVDAYALMGIDEKTLAASKARDNSQFARPERAKTLLTDSIEEKQVSASSIAAAASTDESILSVHSDNEEEEESAESKQIQRVSDVLIGSSSSQSTPASPQTGFSVQVQQVKVKDEPASSSRVGAVPSKPASFANYYKSAKKKKQPDELTAAPDHVLSTYFNLSVLLLILFFGFSVLLLAFRQQVADYVHSHALLHGIPLTRHAHGVHHNYGVTGRLHSGFHNGPGDEEYDPESAAEVLKTQLGAYLAVMGVCALFSSKLMSFGVVSTYLIQQKKIATQQAYLMTHLTVGICGSILLSCRVYISHHQTFVPLHPSEIDWIGTLGLLLIVASFLSVYRFYAWSARASPLIRLVHMGAMGILTIGLLILSAALWSRTKQGPFYPVPPPEYDSDGQGGTPVQALDVMESLWQMELSAQLKMAVLSVAAFISAFYTCLCIVVASQLDRILYDYRAKLNTPNYINA